MSTEPSDIDQIMGAIAAQKFALENLWALVLRDTGGTSEGARATGTEMLRQFEDLAPRIIGDGDPGRVYPVIQHGVDHLESLWRAVEGRLRQAGR